MIMSNPNQAFLGVMMAHKEEIKNENGVETSTTEDSATVVGIVPNSAAAEAGLQENDVITAINDTPINSHQDVVTALTNHVAGEEITVAYTRDGQPATTKATLKGAAEFENIGMGEDENTNVEVSVEEDANGNVTTTTITTVTKNGKETVKKKIEKTTKEDKKN